VAGPILTALKGYLDRSTPGYMVFFVTPFCACRCKMCFNMDAILNAANRDVLTFEEIERIAKNWPGLHQLNFSGGEPLSRKEMPEIVKVFYEHSDTRFFTIPTSSSHPDKFVAAIKKIAEYCPDAWIRITQSVDGVGEVNDEIRQRKGLWDCFVDLNGRLDALCQEHPNLSVGITSVYCKFNEGRNYELLDYAYANLKFTDFGALFVRGKTPDPTAKDVEAQGYVDYQKSCQSRRRERGRPTGLKSRAFAAVNHTVVDYVMDNVINNEYRMPCQAGRRMVVMSDEGDVEPCEVLDYLIKEGTSHVSTSKLGNIREFEYDIRNVLSTNTAKRVAKEIVDTKCHCTFECSTAVNTIYNFRAWPKVAKNFVKLR
jgi:MoaA/NifB/PqqE/SkfB family radical SAM enzyme